MSKMLIYLPSLFSHILSTKTHTHGLQIISGDISELQKNQATTVAKIAQYKRKLMDLSHRVLQVAALFVQPHFVCY